VNYNFPFKGKVIELGGGDNPYFRPNLDVRNGPNIDIVADFNKELPLQDNEYDGVFSSYCIEHISWRNVRSFLKEVYRILKNKGKAVFVTANTKSQMKWVLEQEEWNDDSSSIIFGDQNYDENTHRNSLSPEYAIKLLTEAGFSNIITLPHGQLGTDMIIEASKNTEDRKQLFDKHYFNGGSKVGGYAYEGYWDYPVHWVTLQHILNEHPESVLEIGAARGYIVKRLNGMGIRSKGIEISHHCQMTRVTDDVVEFDICQTPWPFKDKEFDLAFSIAVFEHIPEEYLPAIFNELKRITKRGLHGIDFGEKDDGFDKTHCTLKTLDWWTSRFPDGHKIIDKEELEKGNLIQSIPIGDGKLKVNFGSFINMFHDGWVNLDNIDLQKFADLHKYKYIPFDARGALPFKPNTIDLAYSSHMLEHLTVPEGLLFLRNLHVAMKNGAVIRILVPDTEKLIDLYKKNELSVFDEINDGCAAYSSQSIKLWSILFEGHRTAYDYESLKFMADSTGFKIERKSFGDGHPQIIKETFDMLPDISLIVELTKI